MFLVVADTAQIQPYIFGSNRLRENIGASYLVAQAMGDWARQALPKPNNLDPNTLAIVADSTIEQNNLAAELLYAGGGNVVALFREQQAVEDFERRLSFTILREAPGLNIVLAWEEFDAKGTRTLPDVLKAVFEKLAGEKRCRTLETPLLGLSVSAACRSTGLPAIGLTATESPGGNVRRVRPIGEEEVMPASAEILAKLAVATPHNRQPGQADQRLNKDIPPQQGYAYPRQFDELGRAAGEQSYLAVVHADGNSMGDRIAAIGNRFRGNGQDRAYIEALRAFSAAVETAAQNALRETVRHLEKDILPGKNSGEPEIRHEIEEAEGRAQEIACIRLAQEEGTGAYLLPFRPLVFGGDDVTFVCDGRLGISLALAYLRYFEAFTQDMPDGRGAITACAGIAIVKTHYPFARAYSLAEELCRAAKRRRKEIQAQKPDWDGACLDWHFALSGLAGDLKEIRRREYSAAEGAMTLRPVTLDDTYPSLQRWGVVERGLHAFQRAPWAGRRNKIKALRDALREGGEAVKYFLLKFNEGQDLPPVTQAGPDSGERLQQTGWQEGRCVYFDAIELADWFIPLKAPGQEGDSNATPDNA